MSVYTLEDKIQNDDIRKGFGVCAGKMHKLKENGRLEVWGALKSNMWYEDSIDNMSEVAHMELGSVGAYDNRYKRIEEENIYYWALGLIFLVFSYY